MSDFKELVSNFKFEEIDAGEDVITFDEPGENFYIMIQGQVSVLVPNPAISQWRDHQDNYQQLLQWHHYTIKPLIDLEQEKYTGNDFDADLKKFMNRIERNYTSKEDMLERVKQRLLRKGGTMAVKDAEKLELDTFAIKEMATKNHIKMSEKNLLIYKLTNP